MDRRQRWRLGTGPCRLVLAGLALRLKLKAANAKWRATCAVDVFTLAVRE